uniref:Rho-GAP domain-containing protein n=1 Tax=Steinernema glaseri TaxID=37863 RepID=A0A1I7ZM62_9BILA
MSVFGKRGKEKKKEKSPTERDDSERGSVSTGELKPLRYVFGVPLDDAVKHSKSHDGVPIPVVVRQCLDFVDEKGLDLEGIYRICAPKSRLDEMERSVNESGGPLVFSDAHDAAGLLKRFLRGLPHHVLTDQLRSEFDRVAQECPCAPDDFCRCFVVDVLKALLRRLPKENYFLLAYVCIHAQIVISHSASNKMTVPALGVILQPVLNLSRNVVRIFLYNATNLLCREGSSDSMNCLFDDVVFKRCISKKGTFGSS